MRRYLLALSCFVLAGIVGLGLLSSYRFWVLRDLDEADPRLGQLLRYQEEKIARLPAGAIDTVLIGDSSLGNGIDVREFDVAAGVRASSLALTGNFGFAGGLELLRQLAERQPIRNVILVYSIDAMASGAGHSGHVFVSPRPLVEGLTWGAQLSLLRDYATTLLNGRSATVLARKLLHGGVRQDALPKELYADDYVIIDAQMARSAGLPRAGKGETPRGDLPESDCAALRREKVELPLRARSGACPRSRRVRSRAGLSRRGRSRHCQHRHQGHRELAGRVDG